MAFPIDRNCQGNWGSEVRELEFSLEIRDGRKPRQQRLPNVVSIRRGLMNNRFQAVSSATKETI